MRSFLIVFLCVGALAGGAYLAYYASSHLDEITQAVNTSNSVYGVVQSLPATGTQTTPQAGQWTPPATIPAHPNWTWHMGSGKTYENVVITDLGPTEVTFNHSLGVAHLAYTELPPDVRDELHSNPASPTPAAGSTGPLSTMAELIDGKLVNASGQNVATPDASVKYYAIYYAAGWSPACVTFTPSLAAWYRQFKPAHPGFELIFVSEDRSEAEMYDYMNQTQMPWPAVRYSELPRTNGSYRGPDIQQFANDGIPDLVLLDSRGKVLDDSFSGSAYLGPQGVVDYISRNVGAN